MLCLRCGFPRERHIRANGSCLDARCDAFVAKWVDEAVLPEPQALEQVADAVAALPKLPDPSAEK